MNQNRFAVVATALALCAPIAMADQWNKKTIMTFSAPFEVPGVALESWNLCIFSCDSLG